MPIPKSLDHACDLFCEVVLTLLETLTLLKAIEVLDLDRAAELLSRSSGISGNRHLVILDILLLAEAVFLIELGELAHYHLLDDSFGLVLVFLVVGNLSLDDLLLLIESGLRNVLLVYVNSGNACACKLERDVLCVCSELGSILYCVVCLELNENSGLTLTVYVRADSAVSNYEAADLNVLADGVDLILANATPALQAAAAGTADIPILGTSVTEYGVALDLDDFDGTVGNNISGTSDLAPLEDQAAMLNELFPDAKNVGLIYCSAEANSQYQVDTVKAALEKLGYTCEYYAFSDSNDLSSVATTAATESDVIYLPTDNTVASNTEIINNICLPEKVPVIAGEEGICEGCGVATLSISYYDLGVATGKMALKVLVDGEDISKMPIEYAPQFTKEYNPEICKELGIEVPDDYVAIGADAEEATSEDDADAADDTAEETTEEAE